MDTAPSPQTTLVIVLGASQWPYDDNFNASKAFEHAANKLKKYFLDIFGLPPGNLLWLFDTPLNTRDIDKEICNHLDNLSEQARDVLVYYTGHGRPTEDRSSLYLAILDTQAHDPESSSLRLKSLAKTLKAKARHLRRFYILDCCFAALAQNTLQGASVFDELFRKTLEDVEIPLQGYAGLFSSGKEEMSVILPDHKNTFFTEALLQVLSEGLPSEKYHFSLKDVYSLIDERLISLYKEYHAKYAQTYKPPNPQLYLGNIAFIPFFPNPHAEVEPSNKTIEIQARGNENQQLTGRSLRASPPELFIFDEEEEERKKNEDDYNTAQTIRESARVRHEPSRAKYSPRTPRPNAADLNEGDVRTVRSPIPRRSTQSLAGPSPRVPPRNTEFRRTSTSVRRDPPRTDASPRTHRSNAADRVKADKFLRNSTEHRVAPSPSRIMANFRRMTNFLFGMKEQTYSDYYDADDPYSTENDVRQLYTVLDIGTGYAKAMIIEVVDDIGIVLGVGHHQQSYSHMSDGIITDIPGVIANCNEALLHAEEAAGGVIAPNTIIGISGELVKGDSITITRLREHPTKPITREELESTITLAQQKLLKSAKERIAIEMGYPTIEVRPTNAAVISISIDGYTVSNPIGFCGRHFTLTLFSAFAPLMQLGALETVAQGLDLTLATIVAEPYALARCLGRNASADSGAIFIDVGAGMTDISLVRRGTIERTLMFAIGGRTFTRQLAKHKGLSLKEAEKLKITYSYGSLKGSENNEIRTILASEVQNWIDSVELLIEELAKGELLPPAVYMVGGGSGLPDLSEKLENFPWTERLPFSHQPIIQTIQPAMVTWISDPNHLLKSAQDITPMALAYQAIDLLQDEDGILEQALTQVIHTMRI